MDAINNALTGNFVARPDAVIDLFAGAGGFTLGAYLAGFKVPLCVEVDPALASAHGANFPKTRTVLADIRALKPTDALTAANLRRDEVAGIVGGPPCQGFSIIGKRDPLDPRNELVREFFRWVDSIRPEFFVMENVPGVLNPSLNGSLTSALASTCVHYEILGPLVINAADYGASTNRKRVIILGCRNGMSSGVTEADLKRATREPTTVRESIGDLPALAAAKKGKDGRYFAIYEDVGETLGEYARWARMDPPAGLASATSRYHWKRHRISGYQPTMHSRAVAERFAAVKPGSRDRISRFTRLRLDSPAPTLRAGTGMDRGRFQAARPIHPTENRVITVREAARIQGFPDWFRFHDTTWHSFRMIGNSISPIVATIVLRLFRSRLE